MYHSIIFSDSLEHYLEGNTVNTYDDWHVVPSSRPLFSMPSMKGKFIDLAGGDGSIDLSEAITGYPVFANRTGSWEFIVLNDYGEWSDRYSRIAGYIHGRKLVAVLEDDPNYYYEGRFSLNEWRSEKDWSRIVIEYSVDPYKWDVSATDTPWLWDPFSFETGIIYNGVYVDTSVTPNKIWHGNGLFGGIMVSPNGTNLDFRQEYESGKTGNAPLQPILIARGGNATLTITVGATSKLLYLTADDSNRIQGLVLYRGVWLYNGQPAALNISSGSSAYLSVNFRPGRL